MRELILFIMFPLCLFSQEINQDTIMLVSKEIEHELRWNTNLQLESNNLNQGFLNSMTNGTFITNEMVDNWINNSTGNNNIINSEVINSFEYLIKFDSLHIGISIADNNLLNSSFSDDLLKFAFKGNFLYQDVNLDFGGTNLRASRYQQYKLTFGKVYNKYKFSSSISYLTGNHHLSYIIKQGNLYTAPYGSYLDIAYNINAFVTDTSNFSIFANNGNGLAFDFITDINIQKYNIHFSLTNLGYINWSKSSITFAADSSFNFDGILIDDIFNFNDSILENSTELDDLPDTKNNIFKSYIPANINFNITGSSKFKYLKQYTLGIIAKWQPYSDNKPLSFSKINQGFKESNFKTLYFINSIIQTKYCDMIPKISYGGYSDKANIGLAFSKGKKNKIIIGTHHLQELLNSDQSTSLSFYLKLIKSF